MSLQRLIVECAQRADPDLTAKRIPRKRDWQGRVTHEKPAADNIIVWTMELEEKWLAGLQRSELPRAAGLPKVHLVGIHPTYGFKPVLIRDSHPDLDFVPPQVGWQKDSRSV